MVAYYIVRMYSIEYTINILYAVKRYSKKQKYLNRFSKLIFHFDKNVYIILL